MKTIELGNQNKATLGFLPKGAYIRSAKNKRLLVAADEKNNFLGYLLYDVNFRNMAAYIVHLSTIKSHQKSGVAKALFDELKEITKNNYRGIRVRCRRDYKLSPFWSKLGFIPKREVPGKSKHGSTLTIWWFDHGHPTLFTIAEQQRTSSKSKVVIDANIFFDLNESSSSSNKQSQPLLADWLEEKIELCLTPEIYNEIDRHEDKTMREKSRSFAESFVTLCSPDDIFERVYASLLSFFPKQMSKSAASDLRQLAWTIAAEVNLFVTLDKTLLRKEDHIYNSFGVLIIRPSDLIIEQDSLIREDEYQPVRLSGSSINVERVGAGQSSILEDIFLTHQQETKSEFRLRMQPCLANPLLFETNIIQRGDEKLSFIIYARQNKRELEIPIFRILKSNLSKVLARHLIYHFIKVSSDEKRILTKITDKYLSNDIIEALQENNFVLINRFWVKANLPYTETVKNLSTRLMSLKNDFPQLSLYFQGMLNKLKVHPSSIPHHLKDVERSLFPVKIKETDIPCFVVPIEPIWAMHLFDSDISGQDIFGSNPQLFFNVENVYYRASKPKVLFAPARILWYVSAGKGKFQGVMSIRACSYVEEVVIDTPKPLFKRFRRLGVYKWEDVFKVAKENVNNIIMAFRFSHTEMFSKPLHKDALQNIWKKEIGKSFHIQTSIPISNELFFKLYEMGMNF